MIIKEFSKQLCERFDLKGITSRIFVHSMDCIIIGLALVKVPHRGYKLFFSIFPLWRHTVKECLEIPSFQIPFLDDKGFDIYLPDNLDDSLVLFTLDKCKTQFPLLTGDISFEKFIKYFDWIIEKDDSINSNFLLKLKIYELIYGITIYRNNLDEATNIYTLISNQISQWDTKIFEYWRGNKDEYIKKLLDYDNNKTKITNNVQNNLADPKIHKLPNYRIVP